MSKTKTQTKTKTSTLVAVALVTLAVGGAMAAGIITIKTAPPIPSASSPVSGSITVPPKPIINSITPSKVRCLDEIVIKGSGFSMGRNLLYFDNQPDYALRNSNGSEMKFRMESSVCSNSSEKTICIKILNKDTSQYSECSGSSNLILAAPAGPRPKNLSLEPRIISSPRVIKIKGQNYTSKNAVFVSDKQNLRKWLGDYPASNNGTEISVPISQSTYDTFKENGTLMPYIWVITVNGQGAALQFSVQ